MAGRTDMDIVNVDAAFGLFESQKRGKCMVIGRSGNEGLNIGNIMRCLGGGHPAAGSAVLKDVNADAVEERITERIEGNQQTSVQISDLIAFPVFTVFPDLLIIIKKNCRFLPPCRAV